MPPARFLLLGLALTGCVVPPPPPPRPAPVVVYAAPAPAPAYPAPSPPPIRNPIVRDIQRQLRRHGYYPGATNGIQGPETTAAIRAFQAGHGLPPDGIASPYLLRALRDIPPGS